MADLSGPSFIPKQNAAKTTRKVAGRRIYLLSIFSYVIIFATIVAVASLFAYGQITKSALAKAIAEYDNEISTFNVDEMHEVVELHERLDRVSKLLAENISLRTVFALIENATIDTVQFTDLTLSRVEGNNVSLEANVATDNFDSVLFQRKIYEEATKFASISLENVSMSFGAESNSESDASESGTVRFSAIFDLDASTVPYEPATTSPGTTSPVTSVDTDESSTSSSSSIPDVLPEPGFSTTTP